MERRKRREGRDKEGEGDGVGVWQGEEQGMPEGERENVDSKLLGGRGGRRGGGQYKRDAKNTHMHAHVSNNHRQNTKTRARTSTFSTVLQTSSPNLTRALCCALSVKYRALLSMSKEPCAIHSFGKI